MVKVAVLGHGVVGSGVCEVLQNHKEAFAKRSGKPIELKYVLDLRSFPDVPYADKFVKDFSVIENDPEISIVVEVIGGVKAAYDFTKRSLLAGKNVVTSNKELVATHGSELLEIARKNNLNYLFEASVGGGIPIIRPMHQCLLANDILEITGIINGTTNYILTQMTEKNKDFDVALKEAQQNGYAEADPTADIDGHDTMRKTCILASLAFGKQVYPQFIHTEGIREISLKDILAANENGFTVKLLGKAKMMPNDMIYAITSPFFVARTRPYANVDDVFNSVLIRGDIVGETMFYGRGAGKLPTASAVVADIIDVVKHLEARKYVYWEDSGDNIIYDWHEFSYNYYVRVSGKASESLVNVVKSVLSSDPEPITSSAFEASEAAFKLPKSNERDVNQLLNKLSEAGVKVEAAIRFEE